MGTRIRLIAIFAVLVFCTISAHAGVDRFTNISPEGARISALAVDPLQPSTVYAGSTAGVFKSTDAGESWALFFDTGTVAKRSTEIGVIASLAIDPTHSSTVYAGTETGEVFKTLDGGASWTPSYVMVNRTSPTAVFSSAIAKLVVDPYNPDILYALQGPAVQVSVDGGLSWTARMAGLSLDPNSNVLSLALDPSTPSRVYASTGSGLYVSNDRGQQWKLLRQGGVLDVAVDPKDPAVLYTSTFIQGWSLSSTRDGGKTWDDVPLGPDAAGLAGGVVVDPLSSSAYALTFSVTGVPGGILATSDRGRTWAPLPGSLLKPRRLVIGPAPIHNFYASASDGIDLFKSENGGTTWRRLHKGLNAPWTFDVAADPNEPSTLYAVTSKGVVKSADAGSNWSDPAVSLPNARLAIDPSQPSRLFAFTDRSAMRSTDGGETWTAVDPGPHVRAMAIDPSDSANVYAILEKGLSRSTDGGSVWTPITNVQLPLGYYGFDGSAIAVDPVTPTTIYAGGDGGIMKSMDAGVTWETIFKDSTISWPSFGFHRILIDPRSPSTVYALGWSSLYRSGNAGQSWSMVYPLPGPPTYWYFVDLELDPREPSRLYLAMSTGLLRSLNSGNQWTEFNEGLPTGRINSLTVGAEGNVYVATPRGLFVNSPHDEPVSPSPLSVSLRTHAGNYVSAAGCGFSFVHANASDAGRCEAFWLFDINGGELKDGDTIRLQAAGGGFVVAEGGGNVSGDPSPVNANRAVPGPWETFVILRQSGSGPIQSGDSIALQSIRGGYIAAEGGGRSGCQCDSRLDANRAEAHEWETFVLIFH